MTYGLKEKTIPLKIKRGKRRNKEHKGITKKKLDCEDEKNKFEEELEAMRIGPHILKKGYSY